jgi:hypothetical protein
VDFDPKFLDVDFTKDPRFTLGDLTPAGETFAGVREYGDTFATIPESEWPGLIEKQEAEGGGAERLVTMIFNQGNEGSCVANACAQAHQIVQARQWGKENVVQLSAMSLYKRIGRSAQSGAMVSDGMEELETRGILPLDSAENRARFSHVHTARGFNAPLPGGWPETGQRFLLIERHVIRNTAQMGTALLNQHPVVVGRKGHSICYVALKMKGSSFIVPYPNSWNYDWGIPMGDMDGGFGVDSWGNVQASSGWAFAITQVRDWRA